MGPATSLSFSMTSSTGRLSASRSLSLIGIKKYFLIFSGSFQGAVGPMSVPGIATNILSAALVSSICGPPSQLLYWEFIWEIGVNIKARAGGQDAYVLSRRQVGKAGQTLPPRLNETLGRLPDLLQRPNSSFV